MTPATKRRKKSTATEPNHRVEDAEADVMRLCFKPWVMKSELLSGGELSEMSQFCAEDGIFGHTLMIFDSNPFTLKPLTISAGPLKGRHLMLLEPFSKVFRFMELPPEIRATIYEELFEHWGGSIRIGTVKPKYGTRRAIVRGPRRVNGHTDLEWDSEAGRWIGQARGTFAILGVSKQILLEAAPVFYGNHTFSFESMSDMTLWLESTGGMRSYIRDVELGRYAYRFTKSRRCFNLLKGAHGLRRLHIDYTNVSQSSANAPRYLGTTPEEFAAACKTMLTSLRRSRKKDSEATSILDIIRVTWSTCPHGQYPVIYKPEGGYKAYKGEPHVFAAQCKRFRDEMRSLMASQLGLEEEGEESDE